MAGPRAVDYADYDEVVVGRLVAGRHPGEPIRAADAAEATRRLAQLRFSDGQIAARLGFRRRSVIRIRTRLGIPAALASSGDNQFDRAHNAPNRPKARG